MTSLRTLEKKRIFDVGEEIFFTKKSFFKLFSKTSLALSYSIFTYPEYYEELSSYSASSVIQFLFFL